MKRTVSILLVLAMLASQGSFLLPTAAAQPVHVHSELPAEPREALSWSFEGTSLTISGSGPMALHSPEQPAPWAVHAGETETVIIGDGVTSITPGAFPGFAAVKTLNLGAGLAQIDVGAFADCAALKTVTVSGENQTYHAKNNLLLNRENALLLVPQTCAALTLDGTVGAVGPGVLENVKQLELKPDYPGPIDPQAFGAASEAVVRGTCQSYAAKMDPLTYGVTVSLSHPNTELRNVRVATCMTEGYTGDLVCTDCGAVLEAGQTVPAKGHPTLVHHPAVAPTCTELGNVEYWRCDTCHLTFADLEGTEILKEVVLPKDPDNHIHTEVRNDRAPTCDLKGYTGDTFCADCGQFLKLGDPIEKLPHTVSVTPRKEPTCTEAGHTEIKTCSVCGEVIDPGEEIPALGHVLEHHAAVKATCCAKGNVEYWHCTRCNLNFADAEGTILLETVETEIDFSNHAGPTELRNQKETSCKAPGYTGDTYCTACGELLEKGQEIEKLPHTPIEGERKEPTCTEPGYVSATICAVCGEVLVPGQKLPALGHELEHHAAVKATCAASGNVEYWHCTRCGLNYADAEGTILLETVETAPDPSNHVGSTELRDAKEATCTEAGYTGDTWCLGCNTIIQKGEVIPALGHTITVTPRREPTCTEPGHTEIKTCSVCGEVIDPGEEIPALCHQLTHCPAVTPTCTELGNVEYWRCDRCHLTFSDPEGTQILDEVILQKDPSNHVHTELRNARESTCSQAGYSGDLWCTDCNTLIKSGHPIDKLPHTISVTPRREPTCTEPGHTEIKTCSVCGEVIDPGEEIPALGHVLEHLEAVKATCCAKGNVEYWHCTRCNLNFADAEGTILLETVETEIDSSNHAGPTELRNQKETSCKAPGYTGDTYCTACGELLEKGQEIEKLPHTPIEGERKEPTCTEAGYVSATICAVCGEVLVPGQGLPALGHELEHHAAVQATCAASGNVEYWHCTRCGLNYADAEGTILLKTVETLPDPSNHVGGTELRDAKDATCTEAGYTGDTWCLGCNTIIKKGEIITALGHTITVTPRREPTCTEPGHTEIKICSVCGEVIDPGEEIPALGHQLTHCPAVAPTCTQLGNVEYWRCDRCHLTFSDPEGTEILNEVILPKDPSNHVHTELRNAREATCSQAGYSGDLWCTDCNTLIESGHPIDKLPHTVSVTPRREPTCTEPGHTEIKTCSVCGEVIDPGEEIPALGHVLEHLEAVKATCCAKGNVEYWHCTRCNLNFADAEGTIPLETVETEIDPSNHAGPTEIRGQKETSCKAPGYTGDTYCTACGALLEKGQEIEKLPHTPIEGERKEPTCTEPGYVSATICAVCGEVLVPGEGIPALGHELEHHEAVQATCCAKGNVEYWHCSRCGLNYADAKGTVLLETVETEIDPSNHVGGTELRDAKEATCTEAGYTGDTWCLGCETIIQKGEIIPALGHELEHHEAVQANCCAKGNVEYWHCTRCNLNYADAEGTILLETVETEIDPSNHVGGTELRDAKEATCTEAGYTGDTWCLGCNTIIQKGEIIPALGHTITVTPRKEPTCTEPGHTEIKTCSVCGEVIDPGEEIPALGHRAEHLDGQTATCISSGRLEHWHCAVCGRNYEDEACTRELEEVILPIDPDNHVHTEYRNAREATCTKQGYSGDLYCADCGKTYAKGFKTPIDKNNHLHTERRGAVEATCTQEGFTGDLWCLDCNRLVEEGTVIPCLPHTEKAIGRVEPTCTESGLSGKIVCAVCGKVLDEGHVLPALGHDMVHHEALAPTCTQAGHVEYWHCNRCNLNFADENATQVLEELTLAPDPDCHPQLELHKETASTCTSHGNVQYWHCPDCGKNFSDKAGRHPLETVTKPLDPDNHVHTALQGVRKPTCSHPGYSGDLVCTDCGAVLEWGQELNPIPHTPKTVGHKEPTCTEAGFTGATVCAVCGATLDEGEILPALGHALTYEKGWEATCISEGMAEHWHCSRCDKDYSDEACTHQLRKTVLPRDPSNHVHTALRDKRQPTCTQAGYTGDVYCTDCGALLEQGKAIPKLEHKPTVTGKKAATCTEPGHTGKTVCTVCGQVLDPGKTIPALGHQFGDWYEVTPATTSQAGKAKRTCARCGEVEYKSLPILKNPFKDVKKGQFFYDPVLWSFSNQITTGTSKTRFSPYENCSRGQIVTFLWRNQGKPEPKNTKNPFKDVSKDDYFYKAVLWAVEAGITKGVDATHFRPEAPCNRSATVTFLWRANGCPKPKQSSCPFEDISSNKYYYDAVLWAVEKDITQGVGKKEFDPFGICSRGHIVTFLYRDRKIAK